MPLGLLPEALQPYSAYIFGAAAVVVLLVVLVVLKNVLFRKPKVDPDAGLDEDLAEYPPPPAKGTHQLMFEGRPVRLRLVVLAPSGNNVRITADQAEGVLEAVLPGLGGVADLDRPRIKVWPPQLSQAGFAPTFERHVTRPEPKGKPSKWILVAGPAKAGAKPILVGLALLAGEPSTRGGVHVNMSQWPELFRVKIAE